MPNSNFFYNKEQFAELLSKIKGNRTLRTFADDTGISIAHISRLMNKALENPPAPDTIRKLTLNGNRTKITYEDLMSAAGHIINYDPSLLETKQYENQVKRDQLCSSIIAEAIFSHDDWDCLIKKRAKKTFIDDASILCSSEEDLAYYFPDFLAEFAEGPIKKWYMQYFIPSNLYSTYILFSKITEYFGCIAMQKPRRDSKYTFVVGRFNDWELIKKLSPIGLNANISFLVVDLDERKIIAEKYLCTYKDDEIDDSLSTYLNRTLKFADDPKTLTLLSA